MDMGGLPWITENPAITGMSRWETLTGQRLQNDLNDLQIQDAITKKRQQAAIDKAIQDYFGSAPALGGAQAPLQLGAPAAPGMEAPGGPRGPLAWPQAQPTATMQPTGTPQPQPPDMASLYGELARKIGGIEGGGSTALNFLDKQHVLNQEKEKQQSQDLDKVFESLRGGDVPSAKFFAQRLGFTIPDDIVHNSELMSFMDMAGKYKSNFYGDDIRSFNDFLKEGFQQLHSGKVVDWAGIFSRHPAQRQPTAAEIQAGLPTATQRDYQFWIDKGKTPAEAEALVTNQQPLDIQKKVDWIMQQNPGMSWQEAYDLANRSSSAKGGQGYLWQVKYDAAQKAGFSEQESLMIANGQKMPTDAEIMKMAIEYAKGINRPREFKANVDSAYKEFKQLFGLGGQEAQPQGEDPFGILGQ